jgi:hypothetical protein
MAYEKIIKLVQTLIQKTNENEIDWETTETSDVFQVGFPKYSIRISSEDMDSFGNPHAGISIYNNEGTLIEHAFDSDFFPPLQADSLRKLHDAARRKAMGVDSALDNILNSLNSPF